MAPNPDQSQLFVSRRVVFPEGVRDGGVEVRFGGISAVLSAEEARARVAQPPAGMKVHDLGELVLLPGVVDTHAHINEPGRTEWEGFDTATHAAAAGGITTVVDMPLNSIPPTTTVAGLEAKADAAKGKCWIDHGFWGGVIPGNSEELAALVERGVLGFKAFMIESGVDEFPYSREADLRAAMKILARAGVPLLLHAEAQGPAASSADSRRYAGYLASRPREWENHAIRQAIALARETGCRVHIVHLSSSDALEDIAAAKKEGLPISAETCPHYLTFVSEEISDGATHFKCAPPIRETENRERLWKGLADGVIDFVVSDHSPCTPALKLLERGDFMAAWGGISSIQFSLPATWTGMRARGHGLPELARWMCERTAQFAGLSERKGQIAVGLDADFAVFDPEADFEVDRAMIRHRHPVTPYEGRRLKGVVRQTWLRGAKIYDREAGKHFGAAKGQPLYRFLGGLR